MLTPSSVAYIFCTHLTLAPSYLPHLLSSFPYFKNLQILFEISRINKVEQIENSGDVGGKDKKDGMVNRAETN